MRKVQGPPKKRLHAKELPWLSGPKRARTIAALRRLNGASTRLVTSRDPIRLFKRKLAILTWAAGLTY